MCVCVGVCMYVCDAKIFSEHKCSRFRRIGAKFGTDNGLGLEWVRKEAQSLTLKITKMAAVRIYSFLHKNNVIYRKMEKRFSEHECSRFRRIGTKFGTDDNLGLEWVQRGAPKSYLQNF